jgi:hypothetical protein
MSLLGISLLGMSLFGMSLGGSGLLGGWLELGVVVGTLPAGELFPGGQGFTAVAGVPPGKVGDVALGFVTLGFKDRFDVEGWFPTAPPVVGGVPAPTLVDELPPGLADEGLVDEPGLADEGVAFPAAVPLLARVGLVVALSHGTTTAPGLPETLPALPATAGIPWVIAGAP